MYVSVFQISESLKLLQQFTTDRETVRHAVLRATGELDTQYTPATEPLVEASRQARRCENSAQTRGAAAVGSAPDTAAPPPQLGQEVDMADMAVNALRLTETLQREQQGHSSLFAILALAKQQQALAGRKTILFFSEGLQTPPTLEHVLLAAISEANRANVSVYAVDARGLCDDEHTRAPPATRSRRRSPPACASRCSRGSAAGHPRGDADRRQRRGRAAHGHDRHPGRARREHRGACSSPTPTTCAPGIARAVGDLRGYYEVAYSPSNREFDGHFRGSRSR